MTNFVKTDQRTFRFKVNTTHYGPTTKVVENGPDTGFTDKTAYYQKGICIGYKHNGSYWILGDIV